MWNSIQSAVVLAWETDVLAVFTFAEQTFTPSFDWQLYSSLAPVEN